MLIDIDDVCYFQANDKYTSVFTADGESLIRTPLRELAAQLDPRHFWQVHRGTIVNLRHVATTTRDLAGRVTLHMGTHFVGTSNVRFAMEQGLTPLGTMAHEYLQACQAVGPRLRDSQSFAFNMRALSHQL